jgi:hypothetical protein
MKQGLKPTKRQKLAIKSAGLNYNNWLVFKNHDGMLHLVHRETGAKRVVPN